MLTISHCIYWKFVTETSTTTILTDRYIHITVKTEQRKTRTKVMVITYLTKWTWKIIHKEVNLWTEPLQAFRSFLCFLKNTFKYLEDNLFKQWIHFHISINKKRSKKKTITIAYERRRQRISMNKNLGTKSIKIIHFK